MFAHGPIACLTVGLGGCSMSHTLTSSMVTYVLSVAVYYLGTSSHHIRPVASSRLSHRFPVRAGLDLTPANITFLFSSPHARHAPNLRSPRLPGFNLADDNTASPAGSHPVSTIFQDSLTRYDSIQTDNPLCTDSPQSYMPHRMT